MTKFFLAITICAITSSCNLQSATDNAQADRNEKNIYRLRINPPAGAKYYYNITNETGFTLEIEDKEVENGNKSEVGVLYIINKDSAGNILLTMDYDKLHIYTKANDIETDYDADKAAISINPTEKILGLLKDAELKAVLTPTGEVKEMISRPCGVELNLSRKKSVPVGSACAGLGTAATLRQSVANTINFSSVSYKSFEARRPCKRDVS